MNTIADRIKELRERSDKTQADLAKIIGVSPGTISNYENGAREPSIRIINALVECFGVSADYIMGKTDDESPVYYQKDRERKIMRDEKAHGEYGLGKKESTPNMAEETLYLAIKMFNEGKISKEHFDAIMKRLG